MLVGPPSCVQGAWWRKHGLRCDMERPLKGQNNTPRHSELYRNLRRVRAGHALGESIVRRRYEEFCCPLVSPALAGEVLRAGMTVRQVSKLVSEHGDSVTRARAESVIESDCPCAQVRFSFVLRRSFAHRIVTPCLLAASMSPSRVTAPPSLH